MLPLATRVLFNDWDWLSAERELKRAIELNPNSSVSHQRYGEVPDECHSPQRSCG